MPEEEPIYWQPAAGEHGMTALMYAAYSADADAVEAALTDGADVNAQDASGFTALHWLVDMGTVGHGHEAIMRRLIEAGARLETRNTSGETPLIRCCQAGNEDLARILIEAGADKNACDAEGRSAFATAIIAGYEEIVALLLDHGASADETGADGVSMLELAEQRGWSNVADLMRHWGEVRSLGTDWLATLGKAPREFDEARFSHLLGLMERSCSISFAFRDAFGGPEDTTRPLPASGPLLDEFIADYQRFLARTSLYLLTFRYGDEIVMLFRERFRFEGSKEDWARIQATAATQCGYQEHPWAWRNFFTRCSDPVMVWGMERLVRILRQHRGGEAAAKREIYWGLEPEWYRNGETTG